VASTKHSDRSIFPLSYRSFASASRTFRSAPLFTHA
jgi:hypothetical protein